MRKNLSVFLTVLLLTASTSTRCQELKSEDIYKQSINSIVTLKVEKKGGSKVQGTAFFAIKDGMAVTAWHVVRDAVSVKAKFASGEEFDVSGLVDNDPARDLAIVRVKTFGTPLLPIGSTPSVGQKAYVVGAPLGLEFTISDGLLSQIQVMDGTKAYQFSCPASPGNSGGPLLNAKGEIIGVVSFQFKSGQNLNFAVPIQYALGLDTSLPTKPWNQVVTINTTFETASNKEIDSSIISAHLLIQDINVLLTYLQNEFGKKRNGYRSTIPSPVFRINEDVTDQLKKMSTLASADPIRSKLIVGHKADLEKAQESLNLWIEAIRYAQKYNGWNPVNNEMTSRAFAKTPSKMTAAVQLEELKKNDEFKENIGRVGCIALSVDHKTIKKPEVTFTVGYRSLHIYNSLWIVVIKDKGFADDFGLKLFDSIKSINNIRLTDVFHFKEELIKNQGKEVTILVSREGKDKEITDTLVKDLSKYTF